MNYIWVAVMKVTAKQKKKVRDLGYKVAKGLSDNATLFGAPTPALTVFTPKVDLLRDKIAAEDSTQTRAESANQSEVVHTDLKTYLVFVNNGPAKGDKAKLLLSGFDVNKEKVKHPIPGQIVIKEIVDGATANTAKVKIEKMSAEDYVDRYKVETSPDKVTWTVALDTGNSHKLIVTGLTRSKEVFIRVTGGNTHGYGKPSEVVGFIPR
jgi:hypothetical protein